MADFQTLYRPASLKMERAKQHIAELGARIQHFIRKNQFELVVVSDEYAGKLTYEIEAKTPIPNQFSLIVGDAVHNIRSALDIALFSMIGGLATTPEVVQFPFAKSKAGLPATMNRREVHLAGKNVVDIIQKAEPYEGGNKLLSGLHALDIADKHRLILTTGRFVPIPMDEFLKVEPFPAAFPITAEPGAVVLFTGEGNAIFEFHLPPRHGPMHGGYASKKRKSKFQPIFEIGFGNAEPFAGGVLVPTLNEIAVLVETLCTDMCMAFAEQGPGPL